MATLARLDVLAQFVLKESHRIKNPALSRVKAQTARLGIIG
jgi:predicted transcriptional regulator